MGLASLGVTSRSSLLRGHSLVVASAVGFGVMPYFALDAYASGLTPTALLAYRFGIAAVLIWGFLAVTGRLTRPSRRLLVAGTVLGLAYAAMSEMFFNSVRFLPPALTGLLLYAYPALVALMTGVLARRAPSRRVLMALALSVAGILLTVAPGQLNLGPQAALGFAFGLAAPVIYTGYIVFSGYHAADLPAWPLTGVVTLVAAVALSIMGVSTGGLQVPPPVDAWRPVLLVAVVSTVLAISAFLAGVGLIGPTRASIISTVEPVANLLVGVLFYGYLLSAGQVVGTGLVLGGAALAMLAGRVPGAHDPHVPGAEAA